MLQNYIEAAMAVDLAKKQALAIVHEFLDQEHYGPELEYGADYNSVAIVWDGFDSQNKANNYVSFGVTSHLFVDAADKNVAISQVKTS